MKLMLIGGGDVGRGNSLYETGAIDKEIVRMTGKENPNLLFIGLASNFSDSYYDTIKNIYKELGCVPQYLKKKNILNNRDIVENKMNSADIIYICGGDSIKLVNDLKEYDLVALLESAIKRNCVIAGMSAGAIALCNKGYSDSLMLRKESDSYEFVPGLAFIDIIFSPHSVGEKLEKLEANIGNDTVYALENNAALKIVDDDISVVRSVDSSKAYILSKNKKVLL